MLLFVKKIAKRNKQLPKEAPSCGQRLCVCQIHKMRSGKLPVSGKTIMLLCLASFLGGTIFASRKWTQPDSEANTDLVLPTMSNHDKLSTISRECDHKRVNSILKLENLTFCALMNDFHFIFHIFWQKLAETNSGYIMGEVMKTHQAIQ